MRALVLAEATACMLLDNTTHEVVGLSYIYIYAIPHVLQVVRIVESWFGTFVTTVFVIFR